MVRTGITIGAGAALLATAVLLLGDAAVEPATPVTTAAEPVTRVEPAVAPAAVRDPAAAPTPARQAVSAPQASLLRGRLAGLHAGAPWTAPIGFALSDDEHTFEARLAVTPAGTFEVQLPIWVARAAQLESRVEARDPLYLPLEARPAAAEIRSGELVLAVTVAAVFTGRVVEAAGQGVAAARVAVFALTGSGPAPSSSGETNTRADGTFTLLTPWLGSVLVVAVPMHPTNISGNRFTAPSGAIYDNNQPRRGWLPAAIAADARIGAQHHLGELLLRTAAAVDISVAWPDGRSTAGCTIQSSPTDSEHAPTLSNGLALAWWPNHDVDFAHAELLTDERGRTRGHAHPGREVFVTVSQVAGHVITHARSEFSRLVTAPAAVHLELPGQPVAIAVTSAGSPVAGANLIVRQPIDGERSGTTDANGEVRAIRPVRGALRCVLRKHGFADHEFEFAAGDARSRIEIELQSDGAPGSVR